MSSRSLHRCRIIGLFMVTIWFEYWFHFEQPISIGSVKSCHPLSLCLLFITILTVHRSIRATYPHTRHFSIHLNQLSSWRRMQHISPNVERNIIVSGIATKKTIVITKYTVKVWKFIQNFVQLPPTWKHLRLCPGKNVYYSTEKKCCHCSRGRAGCRHAGIWNFKFWNVIILCTSSFKTFVSNAASGFSTHLALLGIAKKKILPIDLKTNFLTKYIRNNNCIIQIYHSWSIISFNFVLQYLLVILLLKP